MSDQELKAYQILNKIADLKERDQHHPALDYLFKLAGIKVLLEIKNKLDDINETLQEH